MGEHMIRKISVVAAAAVLVAGCQTWTAVTDKVSETADKAQTKVVALLKGDAAPPTLSLCGITMENIAVAPPADTVPDAYRWFSGIWRGGQMKLIELRGAPPAAWEEQTGGPTCSALVVEEVRAN